MKHYPPWQLDEIQHEMRREIEPYDGVRVAMKGTDHR
jgi:hypothetical protein